MLLITAMIVLITSLDPSPDQVAAITTSWIGLVAVGAVIISTMAAAIATWRAAVAANKGAERIGVIVGRTESWEARFKEHSDGIASHTRSIVSIEAEQKAMRVEQHEIKEQLDLRGKRDEEAHQALYDKMDDLERSLDNKLDTHMDHCLARALLSQRGQGGDV